MGKRGNDRSRRQSRTSKRVRPLLANLEREPEREPEREAVLPGPVLDQSATSDGEEEYQYHSILRTNSLRPVRKLEEKLSSKKETVKNSKTSGAERAAIEAVEAQDSAVDSASESSASDGAQSSQEGEDLPNSSAWTWEKENCVEVRRISIGKRDVAVFKVKKSGIAVSGCGWLRVLRGAVSVIGARLNPGSKSLYIVSAPLAPFAVTVVPVQPAENATRSADADWLHTLFSYKDLSAGNVKCGRDEAIVAFAENCNPDVLSENSEIVGQEGEDSDVPSSCTWYLRRAGLPVCVNGRLLVRGLNILGKNEKLPCFTKWDEWDAMTRKLSMCKRASDLRVLVCGSSGTGKSMAVRCIINYLLSRHKEVVLIDTDVGQPEMNIPGVVAAHSVTRMRGGAPAASNRECPVVAGFFGDITPRENPKLYADCIRRVVAGGRSYALNWDCPVVMNSDGWVSGVGASLLELVVNCGAPSHVVSMAFSGQGVGAGRGDCTLGLVQSMEIDRTFRLVSPLPARNSFHSGVSLRDLHVATYFSKELQLGRVRAVCIDELEVRSVGEPIAENSKLAALNACVVALARREGYMDNVSDWNVRGFAIVRGVDAATRNIYIATPVPGEELEKCDALVVASGITIPSALFLAVAEMAAPWLKPPYLTSNLVATGGQMRSRASLHRRR